MAKVIEDNDSFESEYDANEPERSPLARLARFAWRGRWSLILLGILLYTTRLRAEITSLRVSLDVARQQLRLADALNAASTAAAEADARDSAARAAMGLKWGELRKAGESEWEARLWNVARGYDWVKACERTPLEGRAEASGLPNWCELRVLEGVWGHWIAADGSNMHGSPTQ